MDDVAGLQVAAVLAGFVEKRAIVVPVADAGFRLPRIGHDLVGEAAFVIGDHGLRQTIRNLLDVDDAFHLAAVGLQIVVVEVGSDVHAAPPQRKQRIVEIEQVGIVLIDQIAGAVVEILDVGRIGQRIVRMLRAVKPLRIEPCHHWSLPSATVMRPS